MTHHAGDARTPDDSPHVDRRGRDRRREGGQGAQRALGAGNGVEPTPNVLLLFEEGRNRRLLAELFSSEATVTETTDVGALSDDVDLCVVDRASLARNHEVIAARRASVDPLFLPVVLVTPADDSVDPAAWAVVDEVISVPVSRGILRVRLRNLLLRRRASRRLVDRETELEAALAELRVRDRAIAEAPIGITIAGPRAADTPLVYVNDAFCRLTGYDRTEVVGRNCRFLQGEGTDETTVRTVREAIATAEPVSVDVVNYTRDGERFWNRIDVAPVHNRAGEVTHFIGFQTDVTVRKLHEQRVNVLNRLLRHNLRNELNIVDGYVDVLVDEDATAGDRDGALGRIRASVDRLGALSEEVRHVEQVFEEVSAGTRVRPVTDLLADVRNGITERYPDVTVHVETPADPVYVSAEGLSIGCVDYLAMLLAANDRESRRVSLVATLAGDGSVDVELADNGPGLTDADWAVVEAGEETPLRHADQIGLWVLRWVTTTVGGELLRSDEPDHVDGRLHVRCPVRKPPSSERG